ncbi:MULTISPECIES: DUF4232 domain-containing protein [unclassified Streptomyces]|uniref:DUF4232 domain-containing protein n=1 Tax=unclassified Streptomyces TaxID=2593676 RepID=UPI0007482589|nr:MULTISPECIES: DUF4232 domain-containing protein [unclassified Streptomyces]KUL58404.1 hypothetical protein ADL30_11305 [Streptomyces sp. NRRL S-1521]THC44018.1 DUF4232 domain-containing protein [Streptomyces sp. A1499]
MKLTHASKTASKTLLAGLALLGTLALTACDNGDDGSDTAGPRPEPAASASADSGQDGGSGSGSSDKGSDSAGNGSGSGSGSSGNGSEGTAAGTGSNENGEVGICRSDELEVTAADNTTGKEEGIVTVAFKNGGGRDCAINGYAGVDLRTADGDTMSVDRNGEQARREILKDGETAAFNITFPVNNSGGSGVRIAKLLVTPPNETKTVTVAWPAGSLPVSDEASGPKLSVGPVGKVSDSPAG